MTEEAGAAQAPALPPDAVREDLFLGGRLSLRQPVAGYRAATDPVFLAAAVAAQAGQQVLDLGCGVGAAALCLGRRVAGLEIHGLEVQPDYLALAAENARLNAILLALHLGDVARMPRDLRRLGFDHVMMNPPFHRADGAASPVEGRDRAHRESEAGLADWIGAGLARLRPGGWLTVIHLAERLPELLRLLEGRAGAIAARPLAPRAGREAGRVVVRARKGAKGPFRLLGPLVVHGGDTHVKDGDDFSPEARAILRDAGPLDMT